MAKFAVIIPAAGQSSRFQKNKRKKPFVELKGRAVWLRSAELFETREDVVQTIIVINPDDREFFEEKFRPNLAFMNVTVVDGGKERADSVGNAFKIVSEEADYVAIHDAARPLLVKKWIDNVFQSAVEHEAAILATPVTSTVKKVAAADSRIEETVPRDGLWLAQTPQVFRKDLLEKAYAQPDTSTATDEAQLMERLGIPVAVVECPAINLKITSGDDFRMAEVLLDALPKEKSIKSLHPFADEEARFL